MSHIHVKDKGHEDDGIVSSNEVFVDSGISCTQMNVFVDSAISNEVVVDSDIAIRIKIIFSSGQAQKFSRKKLIYTITFRKHSFSSKY